MAGEVDKKDANTFERPQLLLEWIAPERVHIQRGHDFVMKLLIATIVVAFVLVLFKQYSLMLVVFAIAAVTYQVNNTPPRDVRYQFFNNYLMVDDQKYPYDELKAFWFSDVAGHEVLKIQTYMHVPHRLDMILPDDVHQEQVEPLLLKHVPYEEHKESRITKFIEEVIFPITK